MRRLHHIPLLLLVLPLLTACSDHLFDDLISTSDDDADGIAFSPFVTEQADLLYSLGKTRAAGEAPFDSLTIAANAYTSTPLEGGGEWNLHLHRMPLPLVGIHPHTVQGQQTAETATADDDGTSSAATRATAGVDIVGNGIDFHESLTIWGIVYDADNGYHRTLFDQTLLKKIRGWRSSVHWPYDDGKGKYMRFYAVAPSFETLNMSIKDDLETEFSTETGTFTLTPPTFKYTVSEDLSEQYDVLVGSSDPIDVQSGPSNPQVLYPDASSEQEQHLGLDDKTVALHFHHALTAIRFAQGKMPEGITIQEIRLHNIMSEGVYNPATEKWSEVKTPTRYTLPLSHTVTNWNPADNSYLSDDVLFLMPQTFTGNTDAQIIVDLTDTDGNTRTIKTPVGAMEDDVWKPGYTVTYKISVGELKGNYYLLVEPSTDYATTDPAPTSDPDGNTMWVTGEKAVEHSTSAITGSFTIHSFRNFTDISKSPDGSTPTVTNKPHAVGWKITGFADEKKGPYQLTDLNASSFLRALPGWDKDDNDNTNTFTEQSGNDFSYTIKPQDPTKKGNHQTSMSSTTANVANERDLSQYTPNRRNTTGDLMGTLINDLPYNSANCYIVNVKGSYKFPLVYGNSYTGGQEKLYTGGSASDALNPNNLFVDHAGHPIKHANIFQQINDATWSTTETTLGENDLTNDEKTAGGKSGKVVTEEFYAANDLQVALIWQDVAGLFSTNPDGFSRTPAIEGTIGYINFNVGLGTTPMQPGNCVIALQGKKGTKTTRYVYKEDGSTLLSDDYPKESSTNNGTLETLWTWHIWATDEIYPNAQADDNNYQTTDANGNKFVTLNGERTLPVNLGWVPTEQAFRHYDPHEVWIEVEQTESKEGEDKQKVHLKLQQEAQQDLVTGTCTFYQWGRPTALPALFTIEKEAREVYGNTGTDDISASFTLQNNTAMQNAITNPTTMYRTSGDGHFWYPEQQSASNPPALWSDTKTLYDPCPPGFRLPSIDLFKVFSTTGGTAADVTQLNMWKNAGALSKGAYLYTSSGKHSRYDATIYMPATGEWQGDKDANSKMTDTNIYSNASAGFSWTYDTQGTGADSQGQGLWLYPKWGETDDDKKAKNAIMLPYNKSYFSTAMPIRPVAE